MADLIVSRCGQIHHEALNAVIGIASVAKGLSVKDGAMILGHLSRIETALKQCHKKDRTVELAVTGEGSI